MDAVRAKALEFRPKVIIAGWSAYPRQLDFAAFRAIADEVGAKLWVDMAHFAGLVAAGLHPSPVPHADVVSTTVHKTLGGARSGMILAQAGVRQEAINSAVFPGQQGGPLMHVIAAKAAALKIADAPPSSRTARSARFRGAQILADRLTGRRRRQGAAFRVLTGGTDVHLVLVDLRDSAARRPGTPRTCCTRSASPSTATPCPFDPRPPMTTSGLRIGTPALATRGFGDAEFTEVADIIATALAAGASADVPALRHE